MQVCLLSVQFARMGVDDGWQVGGYLAHGKCSIFSNAMGAFVGRSMRCVQVIKGKYVRSTESEAAAASLLC